MSEDLEPELPDMVQELTRQHSHRANYRRESKGTSWTQGHVTSVPPLVYQLLGVTGATNGSGNESKTTFHSKPAARIEALDTVMVIDQEAGDWVDQLGGIVPTDRFYPDTTLPIPGSGTVRRIARLHGLMPSVDRCRRSKGHKHTERCRDRHDALTGTWCCTWHTIEHDVRRWWRQARIVTGWDSPAYRPFNTCPVCDHRGGLRIHVVLQSGMCVECRTTWSPEDFAQLRDHIRAENAEEATA